MIQFEVGGKYRVDDSCNNIIEIVKRSKSYVTISGAFNGRCKIYINYHEIGADEEIFIYSGEHRENLSYCSALFKA